MRLRHLVHADSDSFVVFVASKNFKHKAHVVSRCERCCHNSVFDDLLHSRPIHFMFGYRVGFSWTADLMALFSIRTNSRWRPPPCWIISNGHISAGRVTSTAIVEVADVSDLALSQLGFK